MKSHHTTTRRRGAYFALLAVFILALATPNLFGEGRPRVAILTFQNGSRVREEVKMQDPTVTRSIVPLVGKDVEGNTTFGLSTLTVDRFGELARAELETALVEWDDMDFVDRSQLATLQRELDLNASRGGEREERELLAKKHGVDFFVFGQILGLDQETHAFEGFGVPRRLDKSKALLQIRVVQMAPEKVVFATKAEGTAERITTPFRVSTSSDPYGDAVRKAIEGLVSRKGFRDSFTQRIEVADRSTAETKGELVVVNFKGTPSGAMVEIDGSLVGTTPFKRKLKLLSNHEVRVTKPGFEAWTGKVTVEDGMVVDVELEEKK